MVHIECPNAKELLITDCLGRTINQYSNIKSSQLNIQLPKGIYMVKAILKNGEAKVEKLVVE